MDVGPDGASAAPDPGDVTEVARWPPRGSPWWRVARIGRPRPGRSGVRRQERSNPPHRGAVCDDARLSAPVPARARPPGPKPGAPRAPRRSQRSVMPDRASPRAGQNFRACAPLRLCPPRGGTGHTEARGGACRFGGDLPDVPPERRDLDGTDAGVPHARAVRVFATRTGARRRGRTPSAAPTGLTENCDSRPRRPARRPNVSPCVRVCVHFRGGHTDTRTHRAREGAGVERLDAEVTGPVASRHRRRATPHGVGPHPRRSRGASGPAPARRRTRRPVARSPRRALDRAVAVGGEQGAVPPAPGAHGGTGATPDPVSRLGARLPPALNLAK